MAKKSCTDDITGAPLFITTKSTSKAGIAMAGIVGSNKLPSWYQ